VYSAPGLAVEVGLEIEVGLVVEVGLGLEAGIGAGVVLVVHFQISLEDHHISYPSAMNHEIRITHPMMLDLNSSTACFPSPKCIPVLIPIISHLLM
jgi:hypothetical protein